MGLDEQQPFQPADPNVHGFSLASLSCQQGEDSIRSEDMLPRLSCMQDKNWWVFSCWNNRRITFCFIFSDRRSKCRNKSKHRKTETVGTRMEGTDWNNQKGIVSAAISRPTLSGSVVCVSLLSEALA